MYKVEVKDRTKEQNTTIYFTEDVKALRHLWEVNEEKEIPSITETELNVGAKQDFSMKKSNLVLHNTRGHEGRYYIEELTVKIRWVFCEGKYRKLGKFIATGICKENTYGEGGFELVTCCGNPVLSHYSSSIVPLVSDFEEDFAKEKITMLAYKELEQFSDIEEVNADIAKKSFTDAEAEVLLHDIPGELG